MNISIDSLKQKLTQATQKYVPADEAAYFAELIVDTYLRKPKLADPLKTALSDIQTWQQSETKEYTKTVDKPGITSYDFNGLAPSLKAKEIQDELIQKTRTNGIAAVSIINSAGFHSLKFWTINLEKQGLIAICMANGGPAAVVPFGAKGGKDQSVFGTNPISYAIPTNQDSIIGDMATAQVQFAEIVQAKAGMISLPENAAVDNEGNLTSDPSKTFLEGEIANIAPLGGTYKGSALMLLLEVLTSSLVGAPNSIEMNREKFIPEEHGNLIVAFDIASFSNIETFKKSTTHLAETISHLVPKAGIEKVMYPGEGSHQKKRAKEVEGEVEIEDALFTQLESLL